MAPVISAACFGMPSTSSAMQVASAMVTGTPMAISRQTTAARVPGELAQLKPEARVVKDDRDRERDHRLEGRPEQLARSDITGQRARGEADGQQDDERGDAQAARQHLRSDREGNGQAQADEDLIRGHKRFKQRG